MPRMTPADPARGGEGGGPSSGAGGGAGAAQRATAPRQDLRGRERQSLLPSHRTRKRSAVMAGRHPEAGQVLPWTGQGLSPVWAETRCGVPGDTPKARPDRGRRHIRGLTEFRTASSTVLNTASFPDAGSRAFAALQSGRSAKRPIFGRSRPCRAILKAVAPKMRPTRVICAYALCQHDSRLGGRSARRPRRDCHPGVGDTVGQTVR